ncbi:MAG: ATP-binding cassette domain-containing protein, partial [Eubacteriales bacterium]|nr:ATP-binding cassette domain-containing protein [Eubacteriales bacterium]
DLGKRLISEMSGGQRQRVLLAKALVSEAKLLLLDEPTTGVDEESAHQFYELLYKLNREKGLSIFMITHDVEKICGFASRIFMLQNRGLIEVDTNKLHRDRYALYRHDASQHCCESSDCPWHERKSQAKAALRIHSRKLIARIDRAKGGPQC